MKKIIATFVCLIFTFLIFLLLQDKYIGYTTGWEYESVINIPDDERAEVLSLKKFIYNWYKAERGDGDAAYNLAMHYNLMKNNMEKSIFWFRHGYKTDGSIKCLKGLIETYTFMINTAVLHQKEYISELYKADLKSADTDYLSYNIHEYIWELDEAKLTYENILTELEKFKNNNEKDKLNFNESESY